MDISEEIYANASMIEDNRADSRHRSEAVYVNEDKLETKRPRRFKQSEFRM
ncbi:C-type lectin domain family 4 member M-like [Clarias magur]|uniref:C-type lectin domain family 4 member M-like n=1 Tax=Clarias magur TaxID=1594786 RepID=A0A8J4WWV0_CLAMG|nr:C-type lectin domain family 4 member M-like [Clarias magur]